VAYHSSSPNLWHRWLGHINQKGIEVLVKGRHLPNLKNIQPELCMDYLIGK